MPKIVASKNVFHNVRLKKLEVFQESKQWIAMSVICQLSLSVVVSDYQLSLSVNEAVTRK